MDANTIKAIGKRHAFYALDAGTVQEGRDNLIDTMKDDGLAEFTDAALAAYDESVQATYVARDRGNIY
jgi:hypothetical protein